MSINRSVYKKANVEFKLTQAGRSNRRHLTRSPFSKIQISIPGSKKACSVSVQDLPQAFSFGGMLVSSLFRSSLLLVSVCEGGLLVDPLLVGAAYLSLGLRILTASGCREWQRRGNERFC
ncbi:unnamed protein product [Musa textilis]